MKVTPEVPGKAGVGGAGGFGPLPPPAPQQVALTAALLTLPPSLS